jgi:hypothetical protein
VIHHEQLFADAADYKEASCGPEMPHETAEDIFLDARLRVKLPNELVPFVAMINWWSLAVFHEFLKDYEEQEGGGHISKKATTEIVIKLFQALQNSHDRRTAMKAECYLAVINRQHNSQTIIAKKYGVTRAAVSKIIVQIRDDIGPDTWEKNGLPCPARHMKSDSARESYRKRALRIHKQRKETICKLPTSNSFNRLSTLRDALMQTLVPAS